MRREANRGFRYVVVIVGLLAGLSYVDAGPAAQPVRRRIRQARTDDPAAAGRFSATRLSPSASRPSSRWRTTRRSRLTTICSKELPAPPWSALIEQVAALAHYNRAVVLSSLNRPDEAKSGYEAVDRLFAGSANWPVQLIAAKALVNLGNLLAERTGLPRVARALWTGRRPLRPTQRDDFQFQIAMALMGRAAVVPGTRRARRRTPCAGRTASALRRQDG